MSSDQNDEQQTGIVNFLKDDDDGRGRGGKGSHGSHGSHGSSHGGGGGGGCICFTPGSQVMTKHGLIDVDQIVVGDQVFTRDNGYQQVEWIGKKRVSRYSMNTNPALLGVIVRKDAFGPGMPSRDMTVSQQHRFLLISDKAALHFGEREVLASAKGLIDGERIVMDIPRNTTYIHLMTGRHEVVVADDVMTESFLPGKSSLSTLDIQTRTELLELFPELIDRPDSTVAARMLLKPKETALVV